MKSAIFLVLACIGLSACQSTPVTRTDLVEIKTTVFVPIPDDLTSHGDIPLAKGQTCGSAVEVARARKDFAAELIAKLDAIRRIEGTKDASITCPSPASALPAKPE
jgi:hypothetical protein